jgi:hypothetical protein
MPQRIPAPAMIFIFTFAVGAFMASVLSIFS